MQNIWLSRLEENKAGVIEVDFLHYMGRATLDIIGLAGRNTSTMKAVPPLMNDKLYRIRLRVRLAKVQEGRTQRCIRFVCLHRDGAWDPGQQDHQTNLDNICPHPPQAGTSRVVPPVREAVLTAR